jgi:hypothetical protein
MSERMYLRDLLNGARFDWVNGKLLYQPHGDADLQSGLFQNVKRIPPDHYILDIEFIVPYFPRVIGLDNLFAYVPERTTDNKVIMRRIRIG